MGNEMRPGEGPRPSPPALLFPRSARSVPLGDADDADGEASPALPTGWPKSSAFSWMTTPWPMIEWAVEGEVGVDHVISGLARGVGLDVAEVAEVAGAFLEGSPCSIFLGLKWPPAALPSGELASPNSWTWKPCFPSGQAGQLGLDRGSPSRSW